MTGRWRERPAGCRRSQEETRSRECHDTAVEQRRKQKPGRSSERRAQQSVVTKIVCHLIKRRHENRGVYTNVSHFRLVSPWRIWNPHSTKPDDPDACETRGF